MVQDRQAEVGGNYGVAKKAILLGAKTVQDIDMGVFDQSDPRQLQEFVLVTFGSCVGFCGVGEHANLKVRDIMKDTFGPGMCRLYILPHFWIS